MTAVVDVPTWTVAIPAPCGWLNANDRGHWRQRATQVRQWRHAAGWMARRHRIPKLARVTITAELIFADGRRRDGHNYYPTVKAAIDGLVDVGVLPDDADQHLPEVSIRIGTPDPAAPHGRLVLHIHS